MAGGVALNCVVNGKLLKENVFKNIFIQPAAGDAGGALGAAQVANYLYFDQDRIFLEGTDAMKGALLGPEFTNKEVIKSLNKFKAVYRDVESFSDLCSE